MLSSSNRHRVVSFFFFQAEDGIRDLVRSRGLGDVYKRQHVDRDRALVLAVFLVDPALEIAHQSGSDAVFLSLSLIHI